MADPITETLKSPNAAWTIARTRLPGNPLLFRYLLPNDSLQGRQIALTGMHQAVGINSILAMRLFEEGGVAQVTLATKTDANGINRDTLTIKYRPDADVDRLRAKHEAELFKFAANVNADGSLKNPAYTLWPKPQTDIFDDAKLKALTDEKFAALRQKNPSMPADQLKIIASMQSFIDIFARSANRTHNGDAHYHDYDPATRTLSVRFTQGCAGCKTAEDVTRGNLEKLCISRLKDANGRSLVASVHLVP